MPNRGGHERILIAEDEEIPRCVIVQFLKRAGYRVLEARNGKEALELVSSEKPALAVLDLEMPEMGGLEVINRLRQRGMKLPILVLSGRGELDDRVGGLDLGADDYLTKPFDGVELVARVRALLRRHDRESVTAEVLEVGDARVDLVRKIATVGGAEVRLTRIECAILELLGAHRGQPVSRQQMLDQVWGYTYIPATRTLDTHIWRLRKKLHDDATPPRGITNLSGVGYQLESADSSSSGLPPG